MFGSQDGEKEKNDKGKGGYQPFNPLGVTSAGAGGACNKGKVQQQWLPTCLSAPLLLEAAVADQLTDPRYLEDKVLFARLGSCKLHVGWLWVGAAADFCGLHCGSPSRLVQARRPRSCASYF